MKQSTSKMNRSYNSFAHAGAATISKTMPETWEEPMINIEGTLLTPVYYDDTALLLTNSDLRCFKERHNESWLLS